MTILFTNSELVIQSYILTQVAVPMGGNFDQTVTLDKGGRFVGGSATAGEAPSGPLLRAPLLVNSAGTVIAYGDALTQIRVIMRNESGAQNLTVHVVVFIRR